MPENSNKTLSIDRIRSLSDEEFEREVLKRCDFDLHGNKRRFKYRTTNESIPLLLNIFEPAPDAAILSIAGSSVQLFEMLGRKRFVPKIILSFDYSAKQVGYAYLIKSSIKNLSYDDFRDYMGITKNAISRSRLIKIKRELQGDIPKYFKGFVPRKHAFNKRDIKLNSLNGITWIHNKVRFYEVKRNIDRIKFFQYEIHHENLSLGNIFSRQSFDQVYLSNALDWLCWHNKDIINKDPLLDIYMDVEKIIKKKGSLCLSTLLDRKSYIPDLLKQVNVVRKDLVEMYKYHWLNVKILCK